MTSKLTQQLDCAAIHLISSLDPRRRCCSRRPGERRYCTPGTAGGSPAARLRCTPVSSRRAAAASWCWTPRTARRSMHSRRRWGADSSCRPRMHAQLSALFVWGWQLHARKFSMFGGHSRPMACNKVYAEGTT